MFPLGDERDLGFCVVLCVMQETHRPGIGVGVGVGVCAWILGVWDCVTYSSCMVGRLG